MVSLVLRGEEGSASTFAAVDYETAGDYEETYDASNYDSYFGAEIKRPGVSGVECGYDGRAVYYRDWVGGENIAGDGECFAVEWRLRATRL